MDVMRISPFDESAEPSLALLCANCGVKPATFAKRWCSGRCRLIGEHELKAASPDQIRELCDEIQAGWDDQTRLSRRYDVPQQDIKKIMTVDIQEVRISDMRQ